MEPNLTAETVKAQTLRQLREAGGLSLRAAAERINVHHSTLGRYEDGTYEPQATEIVAMAAAYNVTTEAVIAAVIEGKK